MLLLHLSGRKNFSSVFLGSRVGGEGVTIKQTKGRVTGEKAYKFY